MNLAAPKEARMQYAICPNRLTVKNTRFPSLRLFHRDNRSAGCYHPARQWLFIYIYIFRQQLQDIILLCPSVLYLAELISNCCTRVETLLINFHRSDGFLLRLIIMTSASCDGLRRVNDPCYNPGYYVVHLVVSVGSVRRSEWVNSVRSTST